MATPGDRRPAPGVQRSMDHGGTHRILESVFAVAAPAHEIAGPPAGLALDAVFEIDNDLYLTLRSGPDLVHVGRTDVPKPALNDRGAVRQQPRP